MENLPSTYDIYDGRFGNLLFHFTDEKTEAQCSYGKSGVEQN